MPWQSHVIAFLTSRTSFNSGTNIAKKMELEYMVRLFSERQISTILNSISPQLYDDRHIVVVYSGSEELDGNLGVDVVVDAIGGTIRDCGCVTIAWNEVLKKPTLHIIDVLSVFKKTKDIDTGGLERYLNEILIGVSGCNSILIE
ncbi:MAG: hypothetical protein QXG40_02605 [Ignisphaera sp.]